MAYKGAFTLVELVTQPGVVVVGFVSSKKLERKVRDAGGLVWEKFKEAEKVSMAILEYHFETKSHEESVEILERCFSDEVRVGGRRVYVPAAPLDETLDS